MPASRHSLIVALSLEALQTGLGAADIQGHGTITAAAARRLACDMGIIPAVLGTNSRNTRPREAATGSPPPASGATSACATAAASGPAAIGPPAACEAHHRTHHIDGGPTKEKNLELYCTFLPSLCPLKRGWTYTIIDAHHPALLPTQRRTPPRRQTPTPPGPNPRPNGSNPNPPSAATHPAADKKTGSPEPREIRLRALRGREVGSVAVNAGVRGPVPTAADGSGTLHRRACPPVAANPGARTPAFTAAGSR